MKIAIIGGGNMGGSIACGALEKGVVAPANIKISYPSDHIRKRIVDGGFQVEFTQDNVATIKDADMVVLAVKPWLAEQVLGEIAPAMNPSQILVSIVSGIDLATLAQYVGQASQPIFRVIPNTAITLGKSVTFSSAANATEQNRAMVEALFTPLGEHIYVAEEMVTAVTALASCGIAYAFKYIDASVEGGIQMGVERDQALRIVLQTIKGAVAMLEANGSEPQTEIDRVTTPGGITLRGLNAMQENGFTNAVIQGLKASKW